MAKKYAFDVRALAAVPQTVIAWLFGVNAKTIRDRADIPRNPSGDYDLREVFAWARGRGDDCESLPEAALETVALATDGVAPCHENDVTHTATCRRLADLCARYGKAVPDAIGQMLLDRWIRETQDEPQLDAAFWLQREKADIESVRAGLAEERADAELCFVAVCDMCKRFRHGGRNWSAGKPPFDQRRHRPALCPTCARGAR